MRKKVCGCENGDNIMVEKERRVGERKKRERKKTSL